MTMPLSGRFGQIATTTCSRRAQKMCAPILKCHQLQGGLPPDHPPGALPPGPPRRAPHADPRYRLALPRSPYQPAPPTSNYFRRPCTVLHKGKWATKNVPGKIYGLEFEILAKQLVACFIKSSSTFSEFLSLRFKARMTDH